MGATRSVCRVFSGELCRPCRPVAIIAAVLFFAFFIKTGLAVVGFTKLFLTEQIARDAYGNAREVKDEYDFVIVGGGTAGAVLANRLSEITQWNILLLEAGGKDNFFSDVPFLAAYLQSTALNWNFRAEKQDDICLGIKEERCPLPRGKGLGGSTIINYMIYNRGNPDDFDSWAAAGNKGWSYKDVLPYFRKFENVNFKDTNRTPKRGRGGPVNVEYVSYRSPLVDVFVEANKQLGRDVIDYNGDSQLGVDYLQSTTRRGKRVTAASAYLNSIFGRANLHVRTKARVTKVVIDPANKNATAVEYLWRKKRYIVRANKEIILSAGAYQSPQLLMLSGIGPKSHLEELNIPVLDDLPVGKTMYDHLFLSALTFVTNTTRKTFDTDRIGLNELMEYKRGTGLLTVPGALEALALVKTNNSKEAPDIPDIEFMYLAGSPASDHGTGALRALQWKDEIFDQVYRPLEGKDQFTIATMLFRPKSKGFVKLKDNNPLHWPLIYNNYLKEPEDVETMIEGVKEAIRLLETPAMQAIGARVVDTPIPTCKQHPFATDQYWECLIRSLAGSLYHPVSTCRMGPANDTAAVVSPELKVYGFENLRVVDASVMPYITTGHTQAAVYMIAEKASDMIKAAWYWGQDEFS